MAIVLIIGLVVAVIALSWLAADQAKTIESYEEALTRYAKKRKK